MSRKIVNGSRRKNTVIFSSIAFLALLLSPIVAATTMMSPKLAYASHSDETVQVQEGETLIIEDVQCETDPPGVTVSCEVVEQPPGSRVEGGGTGPSPISISLIWEDAGPPGTYQAVFRTTCVDEDCGDAQGQFHDLTYTIEVIGQEPEPEPEPQPGIPDEVVEEIRARYGQAQEQANQQLREVIAALPFDDDVIGCNEDQLPPGFVCDPETGQPTIDFPDLPGSIGGGAPEG